MGTSVDLVSVILLNYNGSQIIDTIKRSVESIMSQTHKNLELIVVDDASTDGSAEAISKILEKYGTRAILIINERQKGVGGARNAGISEAKGEFLAFIDNDAVPSGEWVELLVGKMRMNDNCGAVVPRVVFMERPEVINSLGSVLNAQAHGNGVGIFQFYEFFSCPQEVMYPTGNGVMVRKELLERIGFFDEGYKKYGHDDSDIGIRIRDEGFSILTEPDAVLQHHHSFSRPITSGSFWDTRNRIRFALKHFSSSEIMSFVFEEIRQIPRNLYSTRLYFLAWASVLISLWPVLEYRFGHKRRASFYRRFEHFMRGDYRFIIFPDNRKYEPGFEIAESIVAGENDTRWLYNGWYRLQRVGGHKCRWAIKASAIKACLPGDGRCRLHYFLPEQLRGQVITVIVRSDSYEWEHELALQDVPYGTPGITEFELPPVSGPATVFFVAKKYVIEESQFPRQLAWGFNTIEFVE